MNHRGEEVKGSLPAGTAGEKRRGQTGGQLFQEGGQEVGQGIDHRQGEGVAGKHGTEGGQAEESHRHQQDCQRCGRRRYQVQEAPEEGGEAQKAPHDGKGNEHHSHSGEGVGDEQAGPVYRQGVHEPHRPGVVEIAPYQRGAGDGVDGPTAAAVM